MPTGQGEIAEDKLESGKSFRNHWARQRVITGVKAEFASEDLPVEAADLQQLRAHGQTHSRLGDGFAARGQVEFESRYQCKEISGASRRDNQGNCVTLEQPAW